MNDTNETSVDETDAGESTAGETRVLTPAQLLEKEKLADMGDRMKRIRNELRINQSDVADTCAVSKSYISKFESGEGNPSPYFFMKLAEYFNISLDYLFLGIGRMFKPEVPDTEDPDKLLDDIKSTDDIIWLMENSQMARGAMIAFMTKYFYENEELINKNIIKDRRRKAKQEEIRAAARRTKSG